MKKDIGKLFVVGYQGEEPSYEFLKFVEEWGIGGIIVFARNLSEPEKLKSRLNKIASAANQSIFTAIDQEGGLVLRILSGGSLFPSAMALSAANSAELAQRCYRAIGREMLSLGLNFNLAPVLDINSPSNPGIGARSFGYTPQIAAKFGCAAIKGLREAGVLACAKHFPGKGEAKIDSHLSLPVIPFAKERLQSIELYPFKRAIAHNVDAIMTSHVFFRAYEKIKNLPATLSKSVLTNLLRDELGFKGLVITDDLEMGAITEAFGVPQSAEMAFMAGADLLLICHSLNFQRQAAERIFEAVKTSNAAAERLNQSLERIKFAREKIKNVPSAKPLSELKKEHEGLIKLVSERSIRFLSVDKALFQLTSASNRLLFCIPQISALVQVEEEHNKYGVKKLVKKAFANSKTVVYQPKSTKKEILALVDKALCKADLQSHTIIFLSYNAHLLKGQLSAIKALAKKCPSMVLAALRNPYDLLCCGEIKTRVASFGFRTPAVLALLNALKGITKPIMRPWPIAT